MPLPRRTRALLLLLLLAAAGGALAWLGLRPRGRVLIGTSFAAAVDGNTALAPGQPFRALLSLPGKLGHGGFVDLELHGAGDGGERLLQVIPVRAAGRDDEIVFAMADVTQLVGTARGQFRLVFTREGRALGEGRFSVRP